MRSPGVRCTAAAAAVTLLAGCGGGPATGGGSDTGTEHRPLHTASPGSGLKRIPDIGERLRSRIPAGSRQVLAVHGEGVDSADATVVLYTRHGNTWDRARSWDGHNGKRGWTTDHREGDKRSPVGVFTLSDAGGVLPDPGSRLPYDRSPAFTPPSSWARTTRHDFDYVVAIDYNRVRGTSPIDPVRPQGQAKGGGIWLHMDHGSGTSGCVSISKSGMAYLLRALDPGLHPVVVMGDSAHLGS